MALEGAERIEFPQDVGSVGNFHDDSQREADLAQAMQGQAHQEGGRHDLEARGFTSDTTGHDAQALLEQNRAQQEIQYEETFQENQLRPMDQPVQDFQKLYGQSENEKGELRRELAARDAEIARLQAMGQMMQPVDTPQFFNQAVPHQAPAQQVPQPQAPQAPQGFNFDPSQLPRMVQGDDDEMMTKGEMEQLLRNTVAPYIAYNEHLAQEAKQAATQGQERLFEAEKQRRGITPQVEQQLLQANPWLRSMTDPNAYLTALSDLKTAQGTQVRPVPQVVPQQVPSNNLTRRITHVERSGSGAVAPAGPQSAEALWQAEWAKTLQYPYGSAERAQAQKALLEMRQGKQVTGYRDPSVLGS